jgi:hypothetical protein
LCIAWARWCCRIRVRQWPLTHHLRGELVKIGARIARHGRCVMFQLAEEPRALFAEILRRVDQLRPKPTPLAA